MVVLGVQYRYCSAVSGDPQYLDLLLVRGRVERLRPRSWHLLCANAHMAESLELRWNQAYDPPPLIEGDTITQADLYKIHVLFLSMTPCSP